MRKGQSRSRTGVHTAIAALAIAVGLGVAGAAGARSTSADHTIEAHAADLVFRPANLTIQTGDR